MKFRNLLAITLALTGVLSSTIGANPNLAPEILLLKVKNSEIVIQGQIVLAKDNPNKTIIIVVGGSGVKTRADTAAINPLFLNMGYSVVNYDRRGNGESTGNYKRPNSKNSAEQIPLFASDVVAIANHLKQKPRFSDSKIIVAGSSMGAWIAPLAASQSKDIDLVISFAGAALSVGQSDHFDYLTDMGLSIEQATGLMHTLKNDTSYNPHDALSKLQQPALWIYGELDDSNPTSADVMQLLTIATEYKRQFDIKVIKWANHEMVNTKTNQMEMSWTQHLSEWINLHL